MQEHYNSWTREALTPPRDLSDEQLTLIEGLYKAGDPRVIGSVANTLLRRDISEGLRAKLEDMVKRYRTDTKINLERVGVNGVNPEPERTGFTGKPYERRTSYFPDVKPYIIERVTKGKFRRGPISHGGKPPKKKRAGNNDKTVY